MDHTSLLLIGTFLTVLIQSSMLLLLDLIEISPVKSILFDRTFRAI